MLHTHVARCIPRIMSRRAPTFAKGVVGGIKLHSNHRAYVSSPACYDGGPENVGYHLCCMYQSSRSALLCSLKQEAYEQCWLHCMQEALPRLS